MGEITTVNKAATRTTSLRTTVPANIVRQFKIEDGDKLEWELEARNNALIIIVKPIKGSV